VIKEQEENEDWERACFAAFRGAVTETWGSYHYLRKAERLWWERGPFKFEVKTLTEGLTLTREQREEAERLAKTIRRVAERMSRYRRMQVWQLKKNLRRR
jgi:hypothetical protein